MDSIHNISIKANMGEDFYLLLGDFLDEFYKASQAIKAMMLEEPPEDMLVAEYVPFLAATAHKLANDNRFAPPRWVFDRRCYLPGGEPFFGCKAQGNLRLLFMFISPPEFKHRNLFVDENVLVRV
ncbi:MAG: hypothetical protein LBT59_18455 [Clostridiales bacterium]|jgi:hypothetical protein|nr:hypothetical protein [Clostridiales bacterium]